MEEIVNIRKYPPPPPSKKNKISRPPGFHKPGCKNTRCQDFFLQTENSRELLKKNQPYADFSVDSSMEK